MDQSDLNELFARQWPKLMLLAERKIGFSHRHQVGPETLVATVMRTVWRRLSEGKLQFEDEESLSKQLYVITLNRLANKLRDANAIKRGGGKCTLPIEALAIAANEDDEVQVLELSEVLGIIESQLEESLRKTLELRLAGCEYEQIAAELGCSTRTVQRKMDIIRRKFSEIFPDAPQATESNQYS